VTVLLYEYAESEEGTCESSCTRQSYYEIYVSALLTRNVCNSDILATVVLSPFLGIATFLRKIVEGMRPKVRIAGLHQPFARILTMRVQPTSLAHPSRRSKTSWFGLVPIVRKR
jgi:hypothetical protein